MSSREVTFWGLLKDISSIKFCIFVPTQTNTREQLAKECDKCGIADKESLLPKENLSSLPFLRQTPNSWKEEPYIIRLFVKYLGKLQNYFSPTRNSHCSSNLSKMRAILLQFWGNCANCGITGLSPANMIMENNLLKKMEMCFP